MLRDVCLLSAFKNVIIRKARQCRAEKRGVREGRAVAEGARESGNTVKYTLHAYVIVATHTHNYWVMFLATVYHLSFPVCKVS